MFVLHLVTTEMLKQFKVAIIIISSSGSSSSMFDKFT